jgi:predicted small lipoprotein YifL
MRFVRSVLLVVLAASAFACGQKGDLVHPDAAPGTPAPEQPQQAKDEISSGGDVD